MTQISQKEAVYNTVVDVLQINGITFEPGQNVASLMTRELRAQVAQRLFSAFRSGLVSLENKYDDTELKAYISGLQSNWLRKDTRFNNDGTSSKKKKVVDPQLKALYNLMEIAPETDRLEIQTHIDARLAEISII